MLLPLGTTLLLLPPPVAVAVTEAAAKEGEVVSTLCTGAATEVVATLEGGVEVGVVVVATTALTVAEFGADVA